MRVSRPSPLWTSCLLILSYSITATGAFGRPIINNAAITNSRPLSSTTSTTSLSAITKNKEHFSPLPYPSPVIVQPGTSPTDEYQSTSPTNPIDSTCTVLIVGSTRGIGLEFLSVCLQKGATVIATHRSNEPPPSIHTLRDEYGDDKLIPLQMDIADETSVEHAALRLQSLISNDDHKLGLLTHIIHNAGIYLPETSFDGKSRGTRAATPPVTPSVLRQTYQINTIAPLLIAQTFVPLLHKRSSSLYPLLAFVSSKVGSMDDNGSGGSYAYRSSKAALNSIAKSLSVDLQDDVRVVLLHPGYVMTDMTGGKGLIDVGESVGGMVGALECTDGYCGFRFVDFKAALIPW